MAIGKGRENRKIFRFMAKVGMDPPKSLCARLLFIFLLDSFVLCEALKFQCISIFLSPTSGLCAGATFQSRYCTQRLVTRTDLLTSGNLQVSLLESYKSSNCSSDLDSVCKSYFPSSTVAPNPLLHISKFVVI